MQSWSVKLLCNFDRLHCVPAMKEEMFYFMVYDLVMFLFCRGS